jgi:hypothetical protein
MWFSEVFSNYFLNWTKFLRLFSEECNHHSGGGSFADKTDSSFLGQ